MAYRDHPEGQFDEEAIIIISCINLIIINCINLNLRLSSWCLRLVECVNPALYGAVVYMLQAIIMASSTYFKVLAHFIVFI